ncbi:MAG: PilZ domain-containing protein [Gammaproteobacteria bacterium]|nr:PilZ domain-containing protein [Gammaproteobacteria bacterium]
MNERRRQPRVRMEMQVKLTHSTFGSRVVETRDFSRTGLFLVLADVPAPPVGSVVQVQLQGLPQEAPTLPMRVVHGDGAGIGLVLSESPRPGEAVRSDGLE